MSLLAPDHASRRNEGGVERSGAQGQDALPRLLEFQSRTGPRRRH
jgi:hypothetical protein